MIAIIDYGAGNLGSVTNALSKLGYGFKITNNPKDLLNAKAVIFPGVGAAGDCMKKLVETGLDEAILSVVERNKPILAICVGLQVLLTGTEEGGWHKCLNIIPGKVRRLKSDLKIPHIGWNQVEQKVKHPIFKGISGKANFYFVHSYYADPDDATVVASTTDYSQTFCSMIIKNNLVATQFHPEKSGIVGLRLFANFFQMALNRE